MSISALICSKSPLVPALRLLALAVPLLASAPAAAEIIPAERMARGITMTPQQCAAWPLTVWVTVARQGYCVRYYMSTAGGEGPMPVVFLQGDRLGTYNIRTRRFSKVTRDEDIDTEQLQRMAENLSKQSGTTAIYLARLGVEGSSGFHGYRKSWLELYVMNAALEAIKRRYGYQGFHLAGQSGGAGLVGGLVILRADIGCAVPGAGRLALLDKQWRDRLPILGPFDPSREIPLIASRRGTRFLVVTDPNDRTVPVQYQSTFVQALRRAGGNVDQFFVYATDENHHGVRVYTFLVVAGCVRGKSSQEITMALARLQERRLAHRRDGRQQQAGSPSSASPSGPRHRRPAPARTASGTPQPSPGPQPFRPRPGTPPGTGPAPVGQPAPARPAAPPSRPMIVPPAFPRTATGGPSSVKPRYY